MFAAARNVLIVSAEDNPATTIRPRLEAAGADMDRVFDVHMRVKGEETALIIPDHIAGLERFIVANDIALVILDPLNTLLPGGINSWRDTDVRNVLSPVRSMARRTGCAVLGVMHLRKSNVGGEAIHQVGGSIAFPAEARSVLVLTRDPDDPDGDRGPQRVLAHAKCNVAPLARSLRYDVEPVTLPSGISTSRMVRIGESEHTARELLDLARRPSDRRRKSEEATDLLLDALGDGQWHPVEPIRGEAVEAGISVSTFERAKRDLRIEHRRSDAFPPIHEWRLPPDLHGSPFIGHDGGPATHGGGMGEP
jgi:hypothetical protein